MFAESPFVGLILGGLLIGCSTQQRASNSEVLESIRQVFINNDLNHDECLSRSEWDLMARTSTEGIKNEASNIEQYRGWTSELFTEMDVDHSNCVTMKEYITLSKKSNPAENTQ
jgi:hypothetical protein